MATFDTHSLFAYSTVLTEPSPSNSGSSLVLASGTGTYFSINQYCVVYPTTVTFPNFTNAEIVRITAISTDTLTITRSELSTTAQSIEVGWNFANVITPSDLTNIETVINSNPFDFVGSIHLPLTGKLEIATGTNSTVGTATLVGGTVTVSTTSVTASSIIFLSNQSGGTVADLGEHYISTITAGTSFVITSTNSLDTAILGWLIIN